MMDDGWFGASFAIAHQIFKHLSGAHRDVHFDTMEEAKVATPYFWDYPKHTGLQVFTTDNHLFYTFKSILVNLATDFKEKLQEAVSQIIAKDILLILIFSHGDGHRDNDLEACLVASGRKSGILVGKDDKEKLGPKNDSAKLKLILSKILSHGCLARMILITIAYLGFWQDPSRTTIHAIGLID